MVPPLEAAQVKEQTRQIFEDAGFEVSDETRWRNVEGSINGNMFEIYAAAQGGGTYSCEGHNAMDLVERLANLPFSVIRHFGVRKSDGTKRGRGTSPPRGKAHGATSPKHSSTYRAEFDDAESLPYHATFQGSDGVHGCLGTKEVEFPEDPRGLNTPSWSNPNLSMGRKQFEHKFSDNMVSHGMSEAKNVSGGRKHFEVTSVLSTSEVGTASTWDKPAGRRYIGVKDTIKADLESQPAPVPARSKSPVRDRATTARDAAWNQFADSLAAPGQRRGRSPGRVGFTDGQ